MTKHFTFAVVSIVAMGSLAGCARGCVPTPLSEGEARQLVMAVSDAIAVEKAGGKVTAESYVPPQRKHVFYYFALTTTLTKATLLDNGIIGYFSVNKQTARVVNVAEKDVAGKELERLQVTLRAQHCIDQSLIDKEKDVAQ